MGNEKETGLFLDIYDLAFDVADPEIFNIIAKRVAIFFGAFSCSLWVDDFRVIETETKLGYYSAEDSQDVSQLDYDISCGTTDFGKPNIDRALDKQKNEWFYISYPFGEDNLTGCYTIWFKRGSEKIFREKSRKTSILMRLADVIKKVISHFLICSKFDHKRIIRELNAAEKIQGSLIPTKKPDISGISIGVRSLMAKEVGGDYLDLVQLDSEKLGIAVGDAMGMGIPGAFIMLTTRAVFRLLTKAKVEPEVLLRQINICLTPDLIQQNMFVSLFYGIYDPRNRSLKYAVAGHNPPIVFRRNSRKIEVLEGKGLIIGGKYQTTYKSFGFVLERGDLIIVYTDGVKDTKNRENEQFGIDGIKNVILNYAEYDAEGVANCLARVLTKYCNSKLNDDASFIVLKLY